MLNVYHAVIADHQLSMFAPASCRVKATAAVDCARVLIIEIENSLVWLRGYMIKLGFDNTLTRNLIEIQLP